MQHRKRTEATSVSTTTLLEDLRQRCHLDLRGSNKDVIAEVTKRLL